MNTKRKLFYIFTPLISGSIVGFILRNKINFDNMIKPFLTPPKIVFPIAWTIIYLLMGYSFYKYKKNNGFKLDKLYYTQLIVNLIWSFLFFLFKLNLVSSLWILLLDYLVIKLVKEYYKINHGLCYLNIPYVIWLTIAIYLNIAIYILN